MIEDMGVFSAYLNKSKSMQIIEIVFTFFDI